MQVVARHFAMWLIVSLLLCACAPATAAVGATVGDASAAAAPEPTVAADADDAVESDSSADPGVAQLFRIGVFTSLDDSVSLSRILDGEYDDQFLPEPGRISLRGGSEYTHWLRVIPDPVQLQQGSDWLLWLDRLPLDRLTFYLPRDGYRAEPQFRAFYYPEGKQGNLTDAFVFELPSPPPQSIYLAISTRAHINLKPQLLTERQYHATERRQTSLHAAVYAAILVLMLGSLAMYLALRDRCYLLFVAVSGSLLLSLMALNGHVYELPVLDLLAWIGPLGIALLLLLFIASSLAFVNDFVRLQHSAPRTSRALRYMAWALFAAAVLCLFNIGTMQGTAYSAALILWPLSALLVIVVAVFAWLCGQRGALGFALIWLLVLIASVVRLAVQHGWVEGDDTGLLGSEMLFAGAMFLLSIALADRVMEFRKQRDQAEQITEQSTASLQLEQQRRELVEGLQESLRGAPFGDLQWIAFRRLLVSLKQLLPHENITLVAFGYQQMDLLLIDPPDADDRIRQLLRERGGNVKGICRGRTPMQLYFTPTDRIVVEPGEPEPDNPVCGRFAVVPLEVAKPGWGGVIIESAEDHQYSNADLQRVADLSRAALEVADTAASQLDLRRRAEIDSLTGTFNRRAGESALTEVFERAQQGRIPLSVLFIDIDHFKRVNDQHGHPVGDECLRTLAECLRRQLRSEDVVSRYGGEEFMALLPGQSQEQAKQIAERIREAVTGLSVRHENGLVKFTISVGVAARTGKEASATELLDRADRAMYQAKRNGRNRVQVAGGYVPGGDDFDPEKLIL